MPSLAEKHRSRWPLAYILADAVLVVLLLCFWWWLVSSILDAWRATPPAERIARLLGVLFAGAVCATVIAVLCWVRHDSPARPNHPASFDPSNTRRPGGAGAPARVVDVSQAPPVAGGRRFADSTLFSLPVPPGVSLEEFAARLGLRHSSSCACLTAPQAALTRGRSWCQWEPSVEVARANGDGLARAAAAGQSVHVLGAVGRWS